MHVISASPHAHHIIALNSVLGHLLACLSCKQAAGSKLESDASFAIWDKSISDIGALNLCTPEALLLYARARECSNRVSRAENSPQAG